MEKIKNIYTVPKQWILCNIVFYEFVKKFKLPRYFAHLKVKETVKQIQGPIWKSNLLRNVIQHVRFHEKGEHVFFFLNHQILVLRVVNIQLTDYELRLYYMMAVGVCVCGQGM